MNKFQIAGRAQVDVTRKFFLTIPVSKNYEALEVKKCVSTGKAKDIIIEAVRTKEALKNHHICEGPSLKYLLSSHPYPLSQGPVNGPLDSAMDEAYSPTAKDEQKLPNDSRKSLEEVMHYRTIFTHSDMQECGEWLPSDEIDSEDTMNRFTQKLYKITNQTYQIHGPASAMENMDVVYTCNHLKCVIHCPCSICCDRRHTCKNICGTEVCQKCNSQCIKHEIKPPRAFDPEIDSYTIITDKLDKYRFAHPYAGIPSTCRSCSQDVLEHQIFHLVFHLRCRLCKFEARPFMYKSVVNFSDYKKAATNVHFRDEKTCKICLFESKDKESRKKHELTVHDKKGKYVCDFCKRSYSNITSLNYHKESHKPNLEKYVCNECGLQFSAEFNLLRHRNAFHGDRSQTEKIKCKKCGECFSLTTNLMRHLKEKHNKKSTNLDFVENLDQTEEFECEFCDSKFRRKSNMIRHILHVHTKKENEFKCSQCGSSYPRKDTLTRHVKSCH